VPTRIEEGGYKKNKNRKKCEGGPDQISMGGVRRGENASAQIRKTKLEGGLPTKKKKKENRPTVAYQYRRISVRWTGEVSSYSTKRAERNVELIRSHIKPENELGDWYGGGVHLGVKGGI